MVKAAKKLTAESLPYWKTSDTPPDAWLDKTFVEVERAGGKNRKTGFLFSDGTEAYMFSFTIGSDEYKVIWPVIKSSRGNSTAARIQATTMLHHDIKAKCMTARVLGIRKAFSSYLVLEDGITIGDLADPELRNQIKLKLPQLLFGDAHNG